LSDPKRIKQILFILICNSLKYTSSGFITLEVKIILDKEFLKIKVIDSGCGMSEDFLRNLFGLFKNLKFKGSIN
jgi:signal transduction histidine kinase